MDKKVYDVVMLPFNNKHFDEIVIATCKYRNLAGQVIGLQSAHHHGYRIVEREVGSNPKLHKGDLNK